MIFIILSVIIAMIIIYSLLAVNKEKDETVIEVVTRPACNSCKPKVKGCVSGLCSKKFGCGK